MIDPGRQTTLRVRHAVAPHAQRLSRIMQSVQTQGPGFEGSILSLRTLARRHRSAALSGPHRKVSVLRETAPIRRDVPSATLCDFPMALLVHRSETTGAFADFVHAYSFPAARTGYACGRAAALSKVTLKYIYRRPRSPTGTVDERALLSER